LPQILQTYEDATDFYSHVKAAQSERTAVNWRTAIDEARRRLDAERPVDPPTDGGVAGDPPALTDFLAKLDVA
jgi:hypothetical protein